MATLFCARVRFQSPPKDEMMRVLLLWESVAQSSRKRPCCQQAWPSARLSKGGRRPSLRSSGSLPLPFVGRLPIECCVAFLAFCAGLERLGVPHGSVCLRNKRKRLLSLTRGASQRL